MYDDGSGYGNMSQAAHGLQTAFQAEQAGMDAATITAGLLHDIGWKLARPPNAEKMAEGGSGGAQYEGASDSIASLEGILSFCAVTGASEEQQRAQHDVKPPRYSSSELHSSKSARNIVADRSSARPGSRCEASSTRSRTSSRATSSRSVT